MSLRPHSQTRPCNEGAVRTALSLFGYLWFQFNAEYVEIPSLQTTRLMNIG